MTWALDRVCYPSAGQPISVQKVQANPAFGNNDKFVPFGAMAPDIQCTRHRPTLWLTATSMSAHYQSAKVLVRLPAAIDRFRVAPDKFVDGGEEVTVFGRYTGTKKHSGADLDAPFCEVYRSSGDRIVSFQQYTDSAQWPG